MQTNDPTPLPRMVTVDASDLPTPPPCCQAARERGYRSGYKDGYTYAFDDAGRTLSQAVWQRFWRFREEVLLPWMRRSWFPPARWERGPRFFPADQKRARKSA
jgi:hypothetical protein